MKIARIAVLAALAAMALSASLGVGTASAVPTALCDTVKDSPYCASEDRLPAGTKVVATGDFEIDTNTVDVVCSESTLSGETTAEADEPLPISFSSWTIGDCKLKGSGRACTVTPQGVPHTGSLAWSGGTNGTLSVGKFGWGLRCWFELYCGYSFEPNPEFEGGTPARLAFSDQTLVKGLPAGLCPETATFKAANYEVTSLNAFAARAQEPPAPATGLCKEAEFWCEAPNVYPKGTTLEGEASNFTIDTTTIYDKLVCDSATLSAETGADYGEPLPLNATEATQFICEFPNTTASQCNVTALTPFNGSLSRTPGTFNGSWSIGGASWVVQCGFALNCTFTAAGGSTATLVGGHGPAIRLKEVPLNVSGICGSSAKLTADYAISSPTPFGVTDVVR